MIEAFGERGIAYATGIMTLVILIYGEILPKTFALLHPTRGSRAVSGGRADHGRAGDRC